MGSSSWIETESEAEDLDPPAAKVEGGQIGVTEFGKHSGAGDVKAPE